MTPLCIGDSHINRLKTFVGKTPSSIVYNVDSLSEVLYYGISGGRVSNPRHLVSLTFAVRRIRPNHVIVMMGSNDLDSADPFFDVECLVFRLIAFLTQLRNTNQLVSITVLSLFHREMTRFVHTDIFNQRLLAANNFFTRTMLVSKHTLLEVKRIYQQSAAHFVRRRTSKQLGTLQTCAPDPRHSTAAAFIILSIS